MTKINPKLFRMATHSNYAYVYIEYERGIENEDKIELKDEFWMPALNASLGTLDLSKLETLQYKTNIKMVDLSWIKSRE